MTIRMELQEVTRKGEYITKPGVASFAAETSPNRLFLTADQWEELGRPVSIMLTITDTTE